jgi:hypothetical protein
MGFLERLRRFFGSVDVPPHHYIDSGLYFPELDVERIRKRMNLVEEGKSRGLQDLPPAEADAFDEVENRIITEIQGEVRVCHEKAMSHIRSYGERLAALRIGTHLAQLVGSANAANTDFLASVDHGRDLLFQLRGDVIGVSDELREFQRENNLKRIPRYPLSRRWHWGVIAVLVLVEASLNGLMLARGLALGLLGGVSQALIIAVINVAAGLLAGRIGLPNISHRKPLRRIVGAVALLVWLCFAAMLNLAVAHYRAALGGENPERADVIAIQDFRTRPFVVPEVTGWLLLILGFSFSIVAAADGWRMDDPYPGYGALARRREEANEEYRTQKEQLMAELQQIRENAIKQMDIVAGEVEARSEHYRSIQQHRRHYVQLFTDHTRYLEQCANELLSTYREANRGSRKSSPPAHFATRWRLAVTDLYAGPSAMEPTLQAQLDDTFNELAASRQRIDQAFQSALSEFERLEELSLENKGATAVSQT